jgi:pyruvate/2-oxoglutarate dehydrogenase complex dihydrolipoamide acyltransferase (E2) component
MARIEVRVPEIGEPIHELLVTRWLCGVGDSVQRNEVIVELETDKATIEFAAQETGRLMDVLVWQGQTAAVGDLLAVIETDAAVPVRRSVQPAAAVAEPRVDCLRCGARMEPAHCAPRMPFAGEPVHLLVCRRCGHVEMIADDPGRF